MNKVTTIMLAAMLALTTSVMAIPTVTMNTFNAQASGQYNATPNAELSYLLDNYVPGATNTIAFGTFCLEQNEYFNPGRTYNVTLNDRAVRGGVSSPTVGYDIISQGTAFLYTGFATGQLTGFTYGSSSAAQTLQNTIWFLEGETSIALNAYYTNLLVSEFGSVANAKGDYAGSSVAVMNLTEANGTRAQDQLVYLGQPVPEAGSVLITLGLGLSVLGMAYSNKR
jgi:hypothetical protein